MNTKMKEIIDAIASNNARSVQKVLSSLQDWISIRINQEYDTLLHLVVCKHFHFPLIPPDNSNEEVLKIFLNSCNSPDIKNCYDESPLHIGILAPKSLIFSIPSRKHFQNQASPRLRR